MVNPLRIKTFRSSQTALGGAQNRGSDSFRGANLFANSTPRMIVIMMSHSHQVIVAKYFGLL
jgi:hypothetical protein